MIPIFFLLTAHLKIISKKHLNGPMIQFRKLKKIEK